jgi:putative ABC transport system permease protein
MRLLVALAYRNALRNIRRTLLTATTVVVGTALLTVAMSWLDGIFGQLIGTGADMAGHARIVDDEYSRREAVMPLYRNLPDADALATQAAALSVAVSAYPRITTGVTLTKGDTVGDTFAPVVGAPVAWFDERLALTDKLMGGSQMPEPPANIWGPGKKLVQIVIGKNLAEDVEAGLGDELVLLGMTQDGAMSPIAGQVVGIADGGNALIDQAVFMPMEGARYLTDMPGAATEILVYTNNRDRTEPLAEALRNLEVPSAIVQEWSKRDPWTGMLAIVWVVKGFLSGLVVFMTALGVWNTMMMSVMERTGEIGVMRAMGLTRPGTVFLFVVEGMAIATLGGIVGVALGGLGGLYLEVVGVELGSRVTQNMGSEIALSSRIYADMSLSVALTSFMLGLTMAIVGTAIPAIRAAAIQPVAAMRARR